EIQAEYDYLLKKFSGLSKFFSISQAQTHGILLSLKDILDTKKIIVPHKIRHEMKILPNSPKKFFTVYQKRKGGFKVNLIPYNDERVIKIAAIFSVTLTPETLRDISMVFQQLDLPFVFTSGICQSGGQCIYEAYVNPRNLTDFSDIRAKLLEIRDVDEVNVIEINLEEM
ncbi:MAG: hypothetical protein ACTSXK_03885, partial [Promethearchaeota archaeon]